MRAATLLLTSILSACAATTAAPETTVVAWPAAPAQARIRFVGSVPAPGGPTRSLGGRIVDALVGREPVEPASAIARPAGVAARGGQVWLADPEARVVWKLALGSSDVQTITCPEPLSLKSPVGVALGPQGQIYVADSGAGRVVVIAPSGECAAAVGEGLLSRPTGVGWDAASASVVVVDAGRHEVLIFGPDGELRRQIGRHGSASGEFNYPTHLALDARGRIFVVDALNFRVKSFDVATGRNLGALGGPGDAEGTLNKAKGIALDSDGHIYVADAMQAKVFLFNDKGDFLLAFGGVGDGAGLMNMPAGVAIDEQDRVFVADALARRVQVYQYLRAEIAR